MLDDSDRAYGNTIIVSRDMRTSSVPLAEALIDGVTAAGLDVLDIGLATTPMNYFAIGSQAAPVSSPKWSIRSVLPVWFRRFPKR